MSYISIANIESLISIICLCFAYGISVTLTGAGQTYIARAMGDSTAEDEGFLTLNPFNHIDAVGTLCLILFRFGWGRQIPINPLFIKHSFHGLRLFLVYSAEALISLVLALCSLICLLPALDNSLFALALNMIVSGSTSTRSIFSLSPHMSTALVIGIVFLLSMIFINTFMATYSILSNCIKYIIARGHSKGYEYMDYADYIMLFGPLIFLFFFAEPLRILLINFTVIAAYYFGLLLGTI